MLGSGALCILTVGTISVCGLVGQARKAAKTSGETTARSAEVVTTTTAMEREETAYTALDTVTWRKASINEYELAEVSAAKKSETTTTKATETEKETETEAQTEEIEEITVEEIADTELYTVSKVYLREAGSKDADTVTVVEKDEQVVAHALTSDGWYAASYDGKDGYIMAAYLTDVAPEAEEEKVEEAPKTNSGVISYTDAEFEMLCYVLQNEVGNCSEQSKIAVANVVINRVKSGLFPNSIYGVLTAPGQFTAVYNYYNGYNPPSQNTRDCALRALQGEDNSNGATYYYAPRYCSGSSASWFESLCFCTELDGQRYFKNW